MEWLAELHATATTPPRGCRGPHPWALRPCRQRPGRRGGTPSRRRGGCWGWLPEFEDGTRVYHSGDTDLFSDMALVRERWAPTIAVLPIGGHYTMGPAHAPPAGAPLG